MKKYLFVAVLFLGACTSFMGKTNYVPIGPQNLSRQVQNAKDMPVFSGPDQVSRPCSRIGFYQVQKLPNDRSVIKREVEKIKEFAAKKGANAIMLKEYASEDSSYPINLSSYFLKYVDDLSPEDEEKIMDFLNSAVAADDAR
jgi:Skp family chaperone for outer membrane proteins